MNIPKGRVLVMDDEMMIQLIAKKMIAHLGYRVDIAENGTEAINLYQAGIDQNDRFSLVILDLTIPEGMNGEETIAALLTIDPNIKAIVSSGYPDVPAVKEFASFGFCDVLLKPFDVQRLNTVLETYA